MAKNKKRKHRTPIAPPIHSAPGTAHAPPRPAAASPPPGPLGAEAPGAPRLSGEAVVARPAPKPRKQTQSSRAAARKRRAKRRTYLIGGSVVLLLIAAFLVPRILSGRAMSEFNTLAEASGCSEITKTAASGEQDHLSEGETAKYSPMPPTHGPHSSSTLPAGVYEEPLSDDPTGDATIYKSVHSLEHGAVIVWHDKLEEDDVDELARTYRDEEKVIVVPFPQLGGKTHLALTAWGRTVSCEQSSTDVVDKFIDLFRNARTAPEPTQPI